MGGDGVGKKKRWIKDFRILTLCFIGGHISEGRMEESSVSLALSWGGVNFLNVARAYISYTQVNCHYTLPPVTVPSASD